MNETIRWCLGVVLWQWILTLSPSVQQRVRFLTSSSCETFCAVFFRFLTEWCADVSVSSGWFFSNNVLSTPFPERPDISQVFLTSW